MIQVKKELLRKTLRYIEHTEMADENWFGQGRSLEELIRDDDMPEIYWELQVLMKGLDQ